jgi:hypothetical protein
MSVHCTAKCNLLSLSVGGSRDDSRCVGLHFRTLLLFLVHFRCLQLESSYTVKKVNDFPVPSLDACHSSNPPWAGIIKFFPSRESLVSDIPAVDGKRANLFLQCMHLFFSNNFV